MYLSSDSPLLTGQRESAAREAACSDARVNATRLQMAQGRANLFQTVIDPNDVAQEIGIPTAVNVDKLQDQSQDGRAAILSNGSGQEINSLQSPSFQDLINGAPEVVSLNAQADQVGCSNVVFSQRPLPKDPKPGMPQRAPNIVRTNMGPMYWRGADPTFVPASSMGLTGYAPPWSDAWVMPQTSGNGAADTGVLGWIKSNPWLALAIAGAGVYAVSEAGKRRRR